ncbi:MAG: methyltransferase regulatory domain-containing protein [Hyphomicrobiales bacterium]
MPFSDVAKSMSSAKLDYACPADILSHLDVFNPTQNHINLINSIGDVVLRETVRDYCMNRRFRSDIFIKGPRSLSVEERDKLLRDLRFVLVRHPKTLDYTALALEIGGTISLNKEVIEPVVAAMAENKFAPKTIAELEAHNTLKDRSVAQIAETLVTLAGSGVISPAAPEDDLSAVQSSCKALNEELLRRTDIAESSNYLASPCIGQGVTANRVQQYFVLAIQDAKKDKKDWVDFAWDRMAAQNFRIIQNNERIEEEDKNKAFLTEQASLFGENQVPLFKAHGVLQQAK